MSDNNKIWILLAAIVSIGVLALAWFVGVSPKLDEKALADQQRATVEEQNKAQEARIASLKKQFENIDELRDELETLQIALPPGDDLSTFLGQLHALEETSGALLTRFAASDAQSYVPAQEAVVDPLVSAENFVVLAIDLTVEGTRSQVLNFINDLQYGERLFLVNQLTVTHEERTTSPEDDTAPLQYTGGISGFVYVLVDPSAPPPAPTQPEPESTPSPSPSPGN